MSAPRGGARARRGGRRDGINLARASLIPSDTSQRRHNSGTDRPSSSDRYGKLGSNSHGRQPNSIRAEKANTTARRGRVAHLQRAGDQSWRKVENAEGAEFKRRMHELFQQLKANRDKERREAIRDGFLADPDKPTSLKNAITPVGTCQDMCPEFERVERIVQLMVDNSEKTYAPSSESRVPCEDFMIKRFRRSAAGYDEQLPSDIRPPVVLQKTLNYLLDEVVGGGETLATVHKFVWDRTRGIRNDFSIQQVSKTEDLKIAVDCFEKIARFHLLCLHQLSHPTRDNGEFDHHQEREQLNNTLLSLMYYYDDSRHKLECPNEAEFRAYCIIFEIQDQRPDLEDRVQTWPEKLVHNRRVETALQLYAAAGTTADEQGPLRSRTKFLVAQGNYAKFWFVVKSSAVSYLMACAAEIYFNFVRSNALETILKAYKTSSSKTKIQDLTLDSITDSLGFDNEEQSQKFCEDHGFTIGEREDGLAFLDLSSVRGRDIVDSNSRRKQVFSRSLVELKRCGRPLQDVIKGRSIAECRKDGVLECSESGEEEDVEDIPLFVADPEPPTEQNTTAPPEKAIPKPAAITASNPFDKTTSRKTLNPFEQAGPRTLTNPFGNTLSKNSRNPFEQAALRAEQNPFAKASAAIAASASIAKPPTVEPSELEKQPTAPNFKFSSVSPFGTSSFKMPSSTSSPVSQIPAQKSNGDPAALRSSSQTPFSFTEAASTNDGSTFNMRPSSTLGISSSPSPFSQVPTQKPNGDPATSISSFQPQFSFVGAAGTSGESSFHMKPSPIRETSQSLASQQPKTFPELSARQPSNFHPISSQNVELPEGARSTSQPQRIEQPQAPLQVTNAEPNPSASLLFQGSPSSQGISLEQVASPQPPKQAELLPRSTQATEDKSFTSPVIPQPEARQEQGHTSLSHQDVQEVDKNENPSRNLSFPQQSLPRFSFSNALSGSQTSSTAMGQASANNISNSLPQASPPTTMPPPSKPSEAPATPKQNNPAVFNPSQAQRQSKILDDIAKETFTSKHGIAEQFIQFHLMSIISESLEQVEGERRTEEAASARRTLLAKKFFKRWREITWNNDLKRRGEEKRKRFAQTIADFARNARSRASLAASALEEVPEKAISTTIPQTSPDPMPSLPTNTNKRVQPKNLPSEARVRRTGAPTQLKPKPLQHFSPPTETLTNGSTKKSKKGISPDRQQKGGIQKHSKSLKDSAIKPTSVLRRNNTSLDASRLHQIYSSSLLDPKLAKKARKLATGRTDTTQTDYFRLKAMGIDPDTPIVPRTKPRKRMREPDGTEEIVPAKSARSTLSSSPHSSSITSETRLVNGTVSGSSESSANTGSRTLRYSADEEELFAAARQLREAMAEGETWFREARERDENRQSSEENRERSVSEVRHTPSRTTLRLQRTGGKGLWDPCRSIGRMERRQDRNDERLKASTMAGDEDDDGVDAALLHPAAAVRGFATFSGGAARNAANGTSTPSTGYAGGSGASADDAIEL